MDKLELKHLSPYLPYGLRIQGITHREIRTLSALSQTSVDVADRDSTYGMWGDLDDIKPILRPMSDLEGSHKHLLDEMEELGQSIEYHNGSFYDGHASFDDAEWLPYYCFQILTREHFDVFGLHQYGLCVYANEL